MSTDFSLANRAVLVTGVNGVLGQRIASEILEDGGSIIGTDLQQESVRGVWADQAGPRFTYYPCDFSSSSSIERLGESLRSNFAVIDGIVHNAALVGSSKLLGWRGSFLEQSPQIWQEALQVNLTAPFQLSQEIHGLLAASSSPSIVAVSSIYGLLGPDWSLYEGTDMSNPAAYAASKGGLISLARWLAGTLGPTIRVNSLVLGGIQRDQPESFVRAYEEKTILGRMAREKDAVGAILFLLSGASEYITGQTLVVDGGYSVK